MLLNFSVKTYKGSAFQGFLEGNGYGCVELHHLAGDRMDEFKCAGVQTHTVGRRGSASITAVARYGATEILHVDSDLILAPGVER